MNGAGIITKMLCRENCWRKTNLKYLFARLHCTTCWMDFNFERWRWSTKIGDIRIRPLELSVNRHANGVKSISQRTKISWVVWFGLIYLLHGYVLHLQLLLRSRIKHCSGFSFRIIQQHHDPFVMQLSSASAINNGNTTTFLLSFELDPRYGVHKA